MKIRVLFLFYLIALSCAGSVEVRAESSTFNADYWSHHRFTPYLKDQSPLSIPESQYLENLFQLTELAMINRLDAANAFGRGQNARALNDFNYKYRRLVDAFQGLTPPKKLEKAQNLILEAMHDQAKFINDWGNSTKAEHENYRRTFHKDNNVQSAHKKLLSAYHILMKTYPKETANNKQAFFDFLCAMDFI